MYTSSTLGGGGHGASSGGCPFFSVSLGSFYFGLGLCFCWFFLQLYTKSSSLFALCDELAHGLSSVEAIECRRLQKSTNPVEQDQESFASGSILPLTVQSKSFSSHFVGTAGMAAKARSPRQEGVPQGGGRQPEEGARRWTAARAPPPPHAGGSPPGAPRGRQQPPACPPDVLCNEITRLQNKTCE